MFKVIINYNATKVIVVTAVVISESVKFSKIKMVILRRAGQQQLFAGSLWIRARRTTATVFRTQLWRVETPRRARYVKRRSKNTALHVQ